MSKMKEFDPSLETWDRFVLRLQGYFVAEQIPDIPENMDRRTAILCQAMGIKLYNRYLDVVGTNTAATQTFDQITASVKDIVQCGPLEMAERFKFASRLQLPSESPSEYMAVLRHLALTCNFAGDAHQVEEKRLRDQFVFGLRSEKARHYLFLHQSDLTLSAVLDLAEQFPCEWQMKQRRKQLKKQRKQLVQQQEQEHKNSAPDSQQQTVPAGILDGKSSTDENKSDASAVSMAEDAPVSEAQPLDQFTVAGPPIDANHADVFETKEIDNELAGPESTVGDTETPRETHENAWDPEFKVDVNEPPEKVETDKLFQETRGLLNDITPQTFETLSKEFLTMEPRMNTKERAEGVVEIVFQMAVDKPGCCKMYSDLCDRMTRQLARHDGATKTASTSANKETNFRYILSSKCQTEFEKETRLDAFVQESHEAINAAETPEKKQKLKDELSVYLMKEKRQTLGHMRFIGELYLKNMLTSKIMHLCVKELLKKSANDDESLECLCKLMSTIGQKIEADHKCYFHPQIRKYYKELEQMLQGPRLTKHRFMVSHLLDLRKSNWQQRRKGGPKTLSQIHKEVEDEKLQQKLDTSVTEAEEQQREQLKQQRRQQQKQQEQEQQHQQKNPVPDCQRQTASAGAPDRRSTSAKNKPGAVAMSMDGDVPVSHSQAQPLDQFTVAVKPVDAEDGDVSETKEVDNELAEPESTVSDAETTSEKSKLEGVGDELLSLLADLKRLEDNTGGRRYSHSFMQLAAKLPASKIKPTFNTDRWTPENLDAVFNLQKAPPLQSRGSSSSSYSFRPAPMGGGVDFSTSWMKPSSPQGRQAYPRRSSDTTGARRGGTRNTGRGSTMKPQPFT